MLHNNPLMVPLWDFQLAPVLTQPEPLFTLNVTLVPTVSGGLWPLLDLQPIMFSAHPIFSWIQTGGKPDLGSEQPAPRGRLQSQSQSSHTKPRGFRGAQVTLMNEPTPAPSADFLSYMSPEGGGGESSHILPVAPGNFAPCLAPGKPFLLLWH